ncbi:MAG: hypothetical protein KF724_06295 [Phycisphaeraceae bacterium]|nr:hypothetical protein [Phycisphaeraceae bacterium]
MLSALGLLTTGCASTSESGHAISSTDSASTASARPGDEAISNEIALATFDAVWKRISETDFDPDHGGVNWVAVREELRPKANAATTQTELRRVLHDMVGRLNRSHFAVIPGEVAQPRRASTRDSSAGRASSPSPGPAASATTTSPSSGDASAPSPADDRRDAQTPSPDGSVDGGRDDATFGLSLRSIESQVVVFDVAEGSSAAKAGVERGWIVRRIGDDDPEPTLALVAQSSGPMARMAAEAYAASLDAGPPGVVRMIFEDNKGVERTLDLERRDSNTRYVKVGALPPMVVSMKSGWVDEETLARAGASGARVGLIRFSVWVPEVGPMVDEAVDALRDADGIIIDLRGNPGGFVGMVMGTGGHFVTEPIGIGTMISRESELNFRLNPRRATRDGRAVSPITAPLAILLDPGSASTSEIFAGGLQDIGRARIFGEASAGAALPAQLYLLPNGDVLLHAFADFRVPSGGTLEGGGVRPDEPRVLTRSSLQAEGDPVLADALRWIRSSTPAVR